MGRALLAVACLLCALVGAARGARAEVPPKREEPREPPRLPAHLNHRLQWKYPRFRPSQYVVTLLVSGASLYLNRGTRGVPNNAFYGGLLLDTPTRNLLVANTPEGRHTAAVVSDFLWHPTQYFGVVDALLTPLITDRGNLDVAAQMTLINWQVQTTTFLIMRAGHRTVGRRRPISAGCAENPSWDELCNPDDSDLLYLNGSFLSGHTAMSFAGAASACSHHFALPMYGGNVADALVCGTLLTSATVIGILRIVADRHWWTDVVAGGLLGTATGFGIPFFFHYGAGPQGGLGGVLGSRFAILPFAAPGALGVSIGLIQ